MTETPRYVLDTSAILAVILGEPEGRKVVEVLEEARQERAAISLPFLALMECEYALLRRFGIEGVTATLHLVQAWPADIIESNEEWRHEAAKIKASGGLSLGDAWIAALATLNDAELVHKDREFDSITSLRSMKL